MKKKGLLLSLLLSTAMAFGVTAVAEEQTAQPAEQQTWSYQTEDGVLSIQAPNEQWHVVSDPNYWFVLSDGGNTITIDHLANGEALPASVVADGETEAVYQAFVSTKNEVFAIKGSAVKQENLEEIMKMIGTIKVLKYDTKKAIIEAPAPTGTGMSVTPINETYYSTSDYLNVRLGCSTNDSVVGNLTYGEAVTVLGSVSQDGKDTGWYQVSYNGTTAYVSASFLSKTKPEEKPAEKQSADTSSDEYFLVYGYDGISVAIHSVGGAMNEDMDGKTYVDQGNGVYFCIPTGEYFGIDPSVWVSGALAGQGMDYSNVNVEGDPYGDTSQGYTDPDQINVEGDPYGNTTPPDQVNVEGDPYGN